MLFTVIEHYRDQDARAVYQRFQEEGRLAPDGLQIHGSWIEAGYGRCFMIVESDNLAIVQEWVLNWNDLVRFEIIPVMTSQETREVVYRRLDADKALAKPESPSV